MRKFLLAFCLGLVVASAVWIALLQIAPREQVNALQTLDYLIEEWTAEREEATDEARQAQVPARIELSNAHPGFFPDTVRALARRIQFLYRIPGGVTLAQWAIESSWGRNNLSASNYFGHSLAAVRQYMAQPRFVMRREKALRNGVIVTGKLVAFASYANIAECFIVHGLYVSRSRRYEKALAQNSSERFALELSKAGYAEDPDYGLKLIAIMRRYNLGSSNDTDN
jgi:flagellum-specific peptidoglycan hydrolase FlgJ